MTRSDSPRVGQPERWINAWLDGVVEGVSTMSQRKLSSIKKHGVSLSAVKIQARKKGVHLLLLEDDKGDKVIAASLKPFEIIC